MPTESDSNQPDKREFTAAEIGKLAALARLNIAPEEMPAAARALGDILKLVAQMRQADPEGARELTHVSTQTRLRDDIPAAPKNREQLLANAPQSEAGFFLTPKVVE